MTVRSSLRKSVRELYEFSWRLLVVNTALSMTVALAVLLAPSVPLALFLAPLVAGPVVAALVHCVLLVIEEESMHLSDAVDGLKRHWRRGLALGAIFGIALLLAGLSVAFYTSSAHRVVPLAALAVYIVAVFCLLLLLVWPRVIAQPDLPLATAFREVWLAFLRAPLRLLGLGLALLAVNLAGALTVLPLLTLTIAYSFLVAAHVVLPQPQVHEGGSTAWQA